MDVITAGQTGPLELSCDTVFGDVDTEIEGFSFDWSETQNFEEADLEIQVATTNCLAD